MKKKIHFPEFVFFYFSVIFIMGIFVNFCTNGEHFNLNSSLGDIATIESSEEHCKLLGS